MLIRVLFNEGNYGYVKPQRLDRLIETREIISFYRKGEAVALGSDTVRSSQNKPYDGPERRKAYK